MVLRHSIENCPILQTQIAQKKQQQQQQQQKKQKQKTKKQTNKQTNKQKTIRIQLLNSVVCCHEK